MRRSIVFLLLLMPGILLGQSQVTVYPTNWVNVERYRESETAGDSYRTLPYYSQERAFVGRQDNNPGYTNTFRMAYKFDLSQVPAGLQVISVKLYMSVTLTSNQPSSLLYEFKIKNLNSSAFLQNASNLWNSIGNASTLGYPDPPLPRIAGFTNQYVGEYFSTHAFSNDIEAHFGGDYYLSFESLDEELTSRDDATHVVDIKNNPNYPPSASIYMQITYRPYHLVEIVNECGPTGSSWDFNLDGGSISHPYTAHWLPATTHSLEMNVHSQVNHSVDSRPYDRIPKHWQKDYPVN